MDDLITLAHGNGGKQAHDLVSRIFADCFGMQRPLTDSAILEESGFTLAFTTDSYVVDPLFFPGGDIGKLAVCGTVNDLSVSGADPEYLSASFIIEEGFPVSELKKIAESMRDESLKAGVRIVTGDTKVVEKGKCDRLFITTSGIGIIEQGKEFLSTGKGIRKGDKVVVSGSLGNHAVAILGARKLLSFSSPVVSDCASLNGMIRNILGKCRKIRFMRDITRGGLSAVLNELAEIISLGIIVNEQNIPVDEPVKGLCEMLGFDPLSLANEGKLLIVIGNGEEDTLINALKSDPLGRGAAIIGEIVPDPGKKVVLNTLAGGRRILDIPSGVQLPRIC